MNNDSSSKNNIFDQPQKVPNFNESIKSSYGPTESIIVPEPIQIRKKSNFINNDTMISNSYTNTINNLSSNTYHRLSKIQEPEISIITEPSLSKNDRIKNNTTKRKEIYIDNADDLPIIIKKDDLKYISPPFSSPLSSPPPLIHDISDSISIDINTNENFNNKKRENEYVNKSYPHKKSKSSSSFITTSDNFNSVNKKYYNNNNDNDSTDDDYSVYSNSSDDSNEDTTNNKNIDHTTNTNNYAINSNHDNSLHNNNSKQDIHNNKNIKDNKDNNRHHTKKSNPTVKSSSLKKNTKLSKEIDIKTIPSTSSKSNKNKNKNKNVLSKIPISPYKPTTNHSSNKENVNPNRRSHRHKNVVNYALPSIRRLVLYN